MAWFWLTPLVGEVKNAGAHLIPRLYAYSSVTTQLVDPRSISPDELLELLACTLLNEEIVAMATDTVFGLIGSATSCRAIESIAAIKKRMEHIPMPVVIGDLSQMDLLFSKVSLGERDWSSHFEEFWPGPLTVVVPLRKGILCDRFFATGTVGLRLPDDDRLRNLAKLVGPLVATSANVHGRPTLQSGTEVLAEMGNSGALLGLSVVLDEISRSTLSSTVVELSDEGYRIVREGAISRITVERAFSFLGR